MKLMNEEDTSKTEIDRTGYFIQKVKEIIDREYIAKQKFPLACVVTFGCQMNAHDSEKISGMLSNMGYVFTDDEKNADLVVYNTCCVRENAENKMYGNLGILKHIKKERKELKVILCGCMMQQDIVVEKVKNAYRMVDIIFGTFNLYKLPELLYTNIETGKQVIDIWEESSEIVEDLPAIRQQMHKASINIMYGCDNFCTYCIVPYVRGRERSRTPEDIITEIKGLAADGVKEIMLLGQNVNSYNGGISFASLLDKAAGVDGIKRIRFMTSHPKDLSDELINAMRSHDNICKHLHLPLQSGSTDILNKMNRRYTKERYLELTDRVRNMIPDIMITTDIIVGFPGETERDFQDTLDVVRNVGFSGAFTFIYSERRGTPAAGMADKVPAEVVNDRFGRLLEELNSGIYRINSSFIGRTLNVFAEEPGKTGDGIISGRTDGNSIVHFPALNGDIEGTIGKFVNVKITDCKTFYLIGEAIDKD